MKTTQHRKEFLKIHLLIFAVQTYLTYHLLQKTESINNHLNLKIQDNAGGIDEKILSKIIEPYFTTKHQSQGTGLGLTNTYKTIVEMHKYLLSFDNCQTIFENKNYKGLNVTITF